MPPKSIFRQPGAKHFQLVHRSQRDPLINDPEASSHVLKPFERENTKKVDTYRFHCFSRAEDLIRENLELISSHFYPLRILPQIPASERLVSMAFTMMTRTMIICNIFVLSASRRMV